MPSSIDKIFSSSALAGALDVSLKSWTIFLLLISKSGTSNVCPAIRFCVIGIPFNSATSIARSASPSSCTAISIVVCLSKIFTTFIFLKDMALQQLFFHSHQLIFSLHPFHLQNIVKRSHATNRQHLH